MFLFQELVLAFNLAEKNVDGGAHFRVTKCCRAGYNYARREPRESKFGGNLKSAHTWGAQIGNENELIE